MNPEDLFNSATPDPTTTEITETKDAAESKDKLYDEVDNLDRQRQEELEPAEEKQKTYGWSERIQQLQNLEVEGEMEAMADDPRTTSEYLLAPPTGVLDTLIGTYNLAMPGNGMDIPQLPKFQDEGAQFARDLSSILLPGLGLAKGIAAGGKALAASRSGKLGAFLNDPLTAWAGTQMANLGGGALADLAAPVQGETGSQTLVGTVKESFPRWTGWLPDNLVVLDKDSPDVIRQKNLMEGSMFGATGSLIEGVGKLARGLDGMRNATEWVPKNEKASNYFNKNVKPEPATVDEVVDASTARMNADRAELGYFNEYQAAARGDLTDESIIFGRDDILFSPAENGIRATDDFGVVGGMVDEARIQGNIETVYGRVRNPMSEGALKYSLQETGAVPDVMRQLGKQLDDAGDFDYITTTGKLIKDSTIKGSADALVADMMGMDMKSLRRTIGNISDKVTTGVGRVPKDKVAREAVQGLLSNTLKQLADPNILRGYAITEAAFSGQIADFAQQMRLNQGTAGFLRAQEQMLDRIEFLMDLEGTTKYAQNSFIRLNNAFERVTNNRKLNADESYALSIKEQIKNAEDPLEVLELIQADTRTMMQSLRQLISERPNFLQPMALAYELTDGNIRSQAALNNYLRQSTGVLRKAFIDGQPEIPSVVMSGFWTTAFNSALAGIKTPMRAAVGNLSTFAFKPATEFIGAYMNGNGSQMNRAMYAYGSVMETVTNAGKYAKNMWVKSGQDPYVLRTRDDFSRKTDDQMKLFKSVADAASAEGNEGPAVLYEIMETQKNMAEHPLLRVGNRGMGTLDAWLNSVNGQFIARMRAYDEVTENGVLPFTQQKANDVSRKAYKAMFDEKGIIRDEQVIAETAQQTFSQDNALSTGFETMIKTIPALRPFFMFTKTPVNSLIYGMKFRPTAAFIDKTRKFGKEFEELDYKHVERLLSGEGIDVTKVNVAAEYNRLRNTYKGSAAIGAAIVSTAVYGYLSDNMTGRVGLYDKRKQAQRRAAGWKPMTAFGVYYGDIPAVSDWMSLTIDIMDNARELGEFDTGEKLQAMAMILGANFLERTQLQNIEQFTDVTSGDPKSIQRWAANTVFTTQSKVGGMLGSLNQVIAPQLKAVEDNMLSQIANRLPGKPGLADKYDYIDGGVVNDLKPLNRLYNALSPLTFHERPSKVKQYLIDVEFDATPTLMMNSSGAPYSKTEQQEVLRIMGEDGYYKKQVEKIMAKYPSEELRAKVWEMRDDGGNPDIRNVDRVHNRLQIALSAAKRRAERKLPELRKMVIQDKIDTKRDENLQRRGDVEAYREFQEDMQKISH
jgi:hypothetical protein